MYCKQCDYPLWNLTTRTCPECGKRFLPSDYEFVPSSVQFCCPHCNQSYYGLGAKGHLVPRSFECVKCNTPVDMDQMVLRPTVGVKEESTRVESLHWLQRKEIGFIKGWFKTIVQVLGRPTRLGELIREHQRGGEAWSFCVITLLATMFLGGATAALLIGVLALGGGGMGGPGAGAIVGAVSLTILGFFVAIFLYMIIWAALAHGLLLMTGGAPQPIGRTFEAFCYSTGVWAIGIVPLVNACVGQYIIPVWWVVAAVLITWKAQGVHGGRATLAVLAFPVLSIVAVAVLYIVMMVAMMSAIGGPGGGTMTTFLGGQTETQNMAQQLRTYSSTSNGAGPRHALMLFHQGLLFEGDFLGSATATYTSDVPVSGSDTLADLATMTFTERQRAITAASAALPANVVAHRVGDFVFTHHGIDLSKPPRSLWLVVMCDDPDAAGGLNAIDPVWVGDDAGAAIPINRSNFASMLAGQNSQRQRYGLPPLPDPLTLTHSQPAGADAPFGE